MWRINTEMLLVDEAPSPTTDMICERKENERVAVDMHEKEKKLPNNGKMFGKIFKGTSVKLKTLVARLAVVFVFFNSVKTHIQTRNDYIDAISLHF